MVNYSQNKSAEKESWVIKKIEDISSSNMYEDDTLRDILSKTIYTNISDGLILDIGCGAGNLTNLLIKGGYDALGIDISFDVLRMAKRINPNNVFIVADVEFPPFKDGSISACLAIDILHHFIRIRRCANELLRILKKDGYIFSMDPNKKNLHTWLAQEYNSPVRYDYLTPNEHSISEEDLLKNFESADSVDVSYLFITRKTFYKGLLGKRIFYKTIGFILPQINSFGKRLLAFFLFNLAHLITPFLSYKRISNVVIGTIKK